MKRISFVLLVLVLATSLFFSCDQKEENGGGSGSTGVGVADPSALPSYTGNIPSDDSYIIAVLSDIVQEVGWEVYYVSDANGIETDTGWTSQYDETVSGYYGGSMDVVGSERGVESQTANAGSYSWTSNVSVQFNDFQGYSYFDTSVAGMGETGERENGSANTDTGAYTWTILYEFGFSVSLSGPDLAGKYILFISAGGSETGTVENEYEFWNRLEYMTVTGTGYLRVYDNDNSLVREIALSQTDMESLYPNPGY